MTVDIERCCKAMDNMISEHLITPFAESGQETGQITVIRSDGLRRDYNQIRYCPFCGKPLRLSFS